MMEQRAIKLQLSLNHSLFTDYFNEQDFLVTVSLESANRREEPEGISTGMYPAYLVRKHKLSSRRFLLGIWKVKNHPMVSVTETHNREYAY